MIAAAQSLSPTPGQLPRTLVPNLPATPGRAANPEPLSPAQEMAQAFDVMSRACEAGRGDIVATIARTALEIPAMGARQAALWSELAAFRPSKDVHAEGERIWLMRRIDGSLVGLFRLRANGHVGLSPHPNEARWRMADGVLTLRDSSDAVKTKFELAGQVGGKAVFIGRHVPNGVVHLLSEVDCAYSRLRTLDPELTSAMAGLYTPDQMIDPELPPTPTVLLAAARTGSHLLINLLNSSGRVFIDGEIFNPDVISVFGADLPRDRKDGLDLLRASDPVRFAKAMLSRSHHVDGRSLGAIGVRGFKLFPEQSRTIYDWALNTPAVRVIHLYRANLLAEFSSYAAAHRDGHWVGGPERDARKKLVFDRDRFERFVALKESYLGHLQGRLESRPGPWRNIEYSNIDRTSVNGLLTFLTGQETDAPLSALGIKQQLSRRVIDRFENPDEVWASLRAMNRGSWADVEMPEVRSL